MNRIENKFSELAGSSALVGFISAGDPDVVKSESVIRAMLDGGVDILELGFPFSDPTADGPVIQRSSERSLKSGMTFERYFSLLASLRKDYSQPIIVFSYFNPIFKYGVERFYKDAKSAGADGVLIVDLPPEENREIEGKFGDDFSVIRLIAPTTPQERVAKITEDASGFVYVISRTGVTGVTSSVGVDIEAVKKHLAEIKESTNIPLCVGFGISTPEQAEAIAECAEGVVIGSAFERIVEDNLDNPALPELLREYTESIKKKLK